MSSGMRVMVLYARDGREARETHTSTRLTSWRDSPFDSSSHDRFYPFHLIARLSPLFRPYPSHNFSSSRHPLLLPPASAGVCLRPFVDSRVTHRLSLPDLALFTLQSSSLDSSQW